MENVSENLRWIPLFPLIGAVISGLWLLFAQRQLPRSIVIGLACAMPALSFFFAFNALLSLAQLEAESRFLVDNVYTWISADPFHAELSFLFDPLSAVMTLVVSGVGFLIHLYSVGYMDDDHRDDRGFQRFFLYLNLFTFSMLMLVLGDNLLVMFVGWEGVGVCSYLLIGFWYLEDHNAMCGQKAFVVNRIGDFGFLLGIFLLFWSFLDAGVPTLEFREMAANVDLLANKAIALPGWLSFLPGFPNWQLLTLAGLFLFIGAAGKSAQIPLYVWLPDAMAGPTPVSALIHAATMVTAGVYMVVRMSFAYNYAPGALSTIAWVGGLTAFFAATIGLCQKDIKKVLAYSTVSQLGYMFLAAGVASYSAAIFHLVTHAFFKALLFLGAGSVILGMHHEQNMDKMGGLRRLMPVTFWTFLLGVLAIAGTPGFSGFFSKDEILLGAFLAHDVPGHGYLYGMGVVTAGMTAFYMFRLFYRTFSGENRSSAEVQRHIHESPTWVLFPLIVLALLAVVGGLIGFPDAWGDPLFGDGDWNSLHAFLEPVAHSAPHEVAHSTEYALAALATSAAGLGVLLATYLYYWRRDVPDKIAAVLSPLYALVFNKYWIDELYARLIIRPLVWFSDHVLYRIVDASVIDGLGVNGIAQLVKGIGDRGLRVLQSGYAQQYVFVMLVGGIAIVAYVLGGI